MKAIAAMSKNRVIGKDGKLPWHIPGDLKFFKKMTHGCRCLVGRKTFESLPFLADREFAVVSRDINYPKTGHKNKVAGILTGISGHSTHVNTQWVIGGAEIYKLALPMCTDLYLTRVLKDYEGDATFPTFDHLFIYNETLESNPEYMIIHYKRRKDA